ENKVLLIKHKKLGFWLAPGGHIEDDELPHQAAEREVWEETGLKVKAISAGEILPKVGKTSYHPLPFSINLHWISPENYQARLASSNPEQRHPSKKWSKGCEQHMVHTYLVQATDHLNFKQNTEETDGIGWFSLEELAEIDTIPEIIEEARRALALTE
ncbi:MAG: NUDIX domain-containing protein, partial [Candidatus Paceibacterota bacterium]